MENAVLDKSIRIEGLDVPSFPDIGDPASREVLGEATESQAMDVGIGWTFNGMHRATSGEEATVFESPDAMRFGPRYYSDEQFERIHRATAERAEPVAPPIPLDD